MKEVTIKGCKCNSVSNTETEIEIKLQKISLKSRITPGFELKIPKNTKCIDINCDYQCGYIYFYLNKKRTKSIFIPACTIADELIGSKDRSFNITVKKKTIVFY